MTYSEATAVLAAIAGGVATVYLLLRSWSLVLGFFVKWAR